MAKTVADGLWEMQALHGQMDEVIATARHNVRLL